MTIDVLNELYEQVRVQPHSYGRDLHGRAADEITRLRAALDAARAKALEDAAKRNELTARSIKEALHLRNWEAAHIIAMKGPAAIRAMIEQEDKG